MAASDRVVQIINGAAASKRVIRSAVQAELGVAIGQVISDQATTLLEAMPAERHLPGTPS